MRKTGEKSHPRREEIISIASALFYEQGFGTTGIKQIIDEAGIAKGTFYTHFESKEALGIEWLRARHSQWNQWFEMVLKKSDTAGEKLLSVYDFLEKWLLECDYRGCAFINTMAETPAFDHPMRKQVADHKKGLHQQFKDLAAEHFQALGDSEKAARNKGTTLYLLFEGALVEAQNFHETWPIENARTTAEQIINAPSSL